MRISAHPCFQNFDRWKGTVKAGYIIINFLGVTRKEEYSSLSTPPKIRNFTNPVNLPPFDEEYFEWIDLLEAVLSSNNRFTMIELGAGFGRWSVNGAIAASRLGKDYRIIAVEAEPQHFKWLQENIVDNGLDKNHCKFVEAAISDSDGKSKFYAGNPAGWYGQRIHYLHNPPISQEDSNRGIHFISVKNITLSSLLKEENLIDLIDMDLQGSEYDVIKSTKKRSHQK